MWIGWRTINRGEKGNCLTLVCHCIILFNLTTFWLVEILGFQLDFHTIQGVEWFLLPGYNSLGEYESHL